MKNIIKLAEIYFKCSLGLMDISQYEDPLIISAHFIESKDKFQVVLSKIYNNGKFEIISKTNIDLSKIKPLINKSLKQKLKDLKNNITSIFSKKDTFYEDVKIAWGVLNDALSKCDSQLNTLTKYFATVITSDTENTIVNKSFKDDFILEDLYSNLSEFKQAVITKAEQYLILNKSFDNLDNSILSNTVSSQANFSFDLWEKLKKNKLNLFKSTNKYYNFRVINKLSGYSIEYFDPKKNEFISIETFDVTPVLEDPKHYSRNIIKRFLESKGLTFKPANVIFFDKTTEIL